MKIAHVAPLYESVPPRLYGGTERIIAYLTEALVDLGHDVTLFASGDTKTSAMLVPCRERALRLDTRPLKSEIAAHLSMLDEVRKRADDFDVIHFHTEAIQFPLLRNKPCPNVTTLHGPIAPRWQSLVTEYNPPLVSCSDSQRLPIPEANWYCAVSCGDVLQ